MFPQEFANKAAATTYNGVRGERQSAYMNAHKTIVAALALAAFLVSPWCIAAQQSPRQGSASHEHGHDMSMPGMNMGLGADDRAESDATKAMQHGQHMDSAHMRMTSLGKATPQDIARADQIAGTLRVALERYKDVRVALGEGYRILMPNLPQPMYHFTNYWNGFLEAFTFDPARPTSLLYTKTKIGYRLIGAMYTAPKTATLEQLNERVPLGVAQWHAHTNLCMPKGGRNATADWKKFGLTGSISTPEACASEGGQFYPQVFGWMVHVYPFESSPDKVWAH
jgi:hypothetical protein